MAAFAEVVKGLTRGMGLVDGRRFDHDGDATNERAALLEKVRAELPFDDDGKFDEVRAVEMRQRAPRTRLIAPILSVAGSISALTGCVLPSRFAAHISLPCGLARAKFKCNNTAAGARFNIGSDGAPRPAPTINQKSRNIIHKF